MAAEDWLPPGWEADYLDYIGRYPLKPKKHIKGCKGKEVVRVNKGTGEEFMGCTNYPKCKWSRNL